MADLREVRCSTDGEPGGNGRGFAGHLLSMRPRRVRAASIADRLSAAIEDSGFGALMAAGPGEQVYFIGPPDGPVKIGFSTSVQTRLADLQAGSPVKLEILAVVAGGRALERAYHSHFREQRLHGEWFTITDEMRQEIKRHAW